MADPQHLPAVVVALPAEIDMAPYETVAVGRLGGKSDPSLAQGVEEALVASKHFQVVDQKRTSAALSEQQLWQVSQYLSNRGNLPDSAK